MQKFSESVLNYICSNILVDQSPAYVLTDSRGTVCRTGGGIKELLSTDIQPGADITEVLPFIQGLLPLDRSPMTLSHVGLESGATITVYIYNTDEGCGFLFVDVTQQETMLAAMQQKANDLVLLRKQQAAVIEKKINRWDSGNLKTRYLDSTVGQQAVSILSAEIRGVESIANRTAADAIFKSITKKMSVAINSIHLEGGIVLQIFGTKLMAVFGILPSSVAPAIQSLRTVESIRTYMQNRANSTDLPAQGPIDFKMAVASGEIWIQKSMFQDGFFPAMVGGCIQKVFTMQALAGDTTILVDRATYENSGQFKNRLKKNPHGMEYLTDSPEAFVWEDFK